MLPIVGLFPESEIFVSGDATQVRPSLYHQGRGAWEKKNITKACEGIFGTSVCK